MVNFYRFLLISIEFDHQLLIFMDTGKALVWKKINGGSPSSDLKYKQYFQEFCDIGSFISFAYNKTNNSHVIFAVSEYFTLRLAYASKL